MPYTPSRMAWKTHRFQHPRLAVAGKYRPSIRTGLPVTPNRAHSCRKGALGHARRPMAPLSEPQRTRLRPLASRSWNMRVVGLGGAAQSFAALGHLLNVEVKGLRCNTHDTVALDINSQPKATSFTKLERCTRFNDWWWPASRSCKRRQLVDRRPKEISKSDPPSTWRPGER